MGSLQQSNDFHFPFDGAKALEQLNMDESSNPSIERHQFNTEGSLEKETRMQQRSKS